MGEVAAVAFLAGGYTVFLGVGTRKAFHGAVEVDKVTVEFGPVDAGEFHLASYCCAAGATHACAVDHHGVERHNGG